MSAVAAAGSVFSPIDAGVRCGPYDIRHLDAEELAESVLSALTHFGCATRVLFEHIREKHQMTVVLRSTGAEVPKAKQIIEGVLRA
jgi:hypothetical protein